MRDFIIRAPGQDAIAAGKSMVSFSGETDDCKRIQRVLSERGFNCTTDQARELWHTYSDFVATSWMRLPESDGFLYALCETFMDFDE